MELLEHAGGLLAARHAEVQPLFRPGKDRRRIILAVVAALAAILLRHRRHHAAGQRLALGELHAVGKRHRRIVPRCTVIGVGGRRQCDARHELRDLLSRERRHALGQAVKSREQAVQPCPLLRRERRVLRQKGRDRRTRLDAHAASAANALSASISCRRANSMKLSAGDTR